MSTKISIYKVNLLYIFSQIKCNCINEAISNIASESLH